MIDEAPLITWGSPAARRLGAGLILLLVLLYTLLLNPYWVRFGDSELYLCAARNLAQGKGYNFNGQPIAIAPPGWPLVLAAAMKLTSRLLWLKLIPMASTIGFLIASFFLLRRFTTPLVASLCVLTTALLDPVVSLGYLFYSDGLFSLLAILGVILAFQINDGKDSWRQIGILTLLGTAATCIRWAGAPWLALIAAALLSGELRPRLNRRWAALSITAAAIILSFVFLRRALHTDPARLDPRYDTFVATNYDVLNADEKASEPVQRISSLGQWLAGLFWRPWVTYRATRPLADVVGWIVLVLIALWAGEKAFKRQWIGLGMIVYLVFLAMIWPDPMSRYLVPSAPLLLLAVYHGINRFVTMLPQIPAWVKPLGLNLFFASILSINGLLYLANVALMRSRHFYERYDAGVHKQLIDAAWYLNHQPRGGYEIAISGRWVNFGREFHTDGYRRALNFLTNRPIVTMGLDLPAGQIQRDLCREPDAQVVQWLNQHHCRYYLYQPPISLIEHFYQPMSHNGVPITQDQIAWRLYEIIGDQAIRIPLPATTDWPQSVPRP